ncbi:MAG: hypothetical protein WA771_07460, partial [Chthoniobacterales bacterium]
MTKPAFAAALLVTFLTGCGFTVTTRTVPPSDALPAIAPSTPAVKKNPAAQLAALATQAGDDPAALQTAAEFALVVGDKLRNRDPQAAVGFFSSALELGLRAAEADPDPRAHDDTINAATLQLVTLADRPQDPRRTVDTPLGPRTIDVTSAFTNDPTQPAFDQLVPSELISVTGFTYRVTIPGFGVPLVGVHESSTIPFYERRGTFTPVTAVPRLARRVEAADLTIELLDPRHQQTVETPTGTATLAADFTTPIALVFDRLNDLALGIRGLLFVGDQMKLAGLYMLEPYDPDRIPVLMVHGLSSSPLIWRNLINELQIDPVIRENYQFWVIYYPSGVSTIASAAYLRDQLAAIRQTFDPAGDDLASRDLITFGHSMGGVITRMNAVEIEDRLWETISDRPFEDAPLDPEDRETLATRLFWEPLPQLHRAVYFSAPHRGATLADGSLATFGMRLIRLPADTLAFQTRLVKTLGSFLVLDFDISELTNSIGSLSPRNPVFTAVDN